MSCSPFSSYPNLSSVGLLNALGPVRVRNLKHTGHLKAPCGCWRDHHEHTTGEQTFWCSAADCMNPATVGAHVVRVDYGLESLVAQIAVLCDGCNKRDGAFELNASAKLAPADVGLSCLLR